MQSRGISPSKNSAVNNLRPAGAAEHFSSKNSAANGVPPAGAQVPVDTAKHLSVRQAPLSPLGSSSPAPDAARWRRGPPAGRAGGADATADLPILDSQSERH